LRRLLLILLDNAIKYSKPGGEVQLYLRLCQRGDKRTAVLEVRDQGIGIAPEDYDASLRTVKISRTVFSSDRRGFPCLVGHPRPHSYPGRNAVPIGSHTGLPDSSGYPPVRISAVG
jgi:Histidine kinase-, DNA gyrase B-, and HSP90-like ATPase